MIFVNEIPDKPLDIYVQGIVYYNGYNPDFDMERFLPDGTTNLIIDFKDEPKFIFDNESLQRKQQCDTAWFSGMHTKYLTISSGDNSEMMVITFKPGFSYPFIQGPLSDYQNKVVQATAIFGDSILNLRKELMVMDTPKSKLDLVANWLLSLLSETSFSESIIRQFVTEIRESPDLVNLNIIARRSGYSQKQFIHLFKKYVGLTPKQFHRIVRFNEILSAIHTKSEVDWIPMAIGCGYYDQAHFIKDFQEFSGLNPEKYMVDQGEWAHYIPLR
jgi:AraC-like DNA-binding protein